MKSEVVDKMSQLMTAAFGLVAALAWNGAIQGVFKQWYGEATTLTAMFSYAIIVTIIAVFATLWIGKLAEKAK